MNSSTTSASTRPVLVTASVILAVPADENELFERLEAVVEQLHQAVQRSFSGDPGFDQVGATAFHYLDDESENARRCDQCNKWATDVDQPDRLDGLDYGSIVDGRFLCEQCRVHLIAIGELADPITGRRRPAG